MTDWAQHTKQQEQKIIDPTCTLCVQVALRSRCWRLRASLQAGSPSAQQMHATLTPFATTRCATHWVFHTTKHEDYLVP
jgi:hypothetical protein